MHIYIYIFIYIHTHKLLMKFLIARATTVTQRHCNTLQRPSMHYNTLQHTESPKFHRRRNNGHSATLQRTATRCNTLQVPNSPSPESSILSHESYVLSTEPYIHFKLPNTFIKGVPYSIITSIFNMNQTPFPI